MPKQRVKVIPRDVCKHLPYLTRCASNVPWATAKRIFIIIPTNIRLPNWPASVAQWANALAEPQCSGPGWLYRRRGFDSRCRHVESGFLHAEIKFSGRYRGSACVLLQMWQAITPGLGVSGCGESRLCGQQMAGASGHIGGPHFGILLEKSAGKLGFINILLFEGCPLLEQPLGYNKRTTSGFFSRNFSCYLATYTLLQAIRFASGRSLDT